ncbi:MAG: RNA-directed DNA polymerase, partial [Nitrososphaerales archaeon]
NEAINGENGRLAYSSEDKANILATAFQTVSSTANYSEKFKEHKKIEDNISNYIHTRRSEEANRLNDKITLKEIKAAIAKSKKGSSVGIDKISNEMLQHLPEIVITVITILFNEIMQEGYVPKIWKHAIVIPILKPAKPAQDPASYRPIALTSHLGKLLERIITNRLSWFMEKNNLINKNQSGFRKNHSTIDHIINLQDIINKYNNNKGYTVAIFLDFEKAYDMLWQNGLLVKLSKIGITDGIINYIKSLLENRTFQVKIKESLSVIKTLENGTPQGSVISPLLFLNMINDLPDVINQAILSLFADDGCLLKSGRNLKYLEKIIQENLNNILEWCDNWGFKLSASKTIGVVFTHQRNINISLQIENKDIQMSNEAKFLGLYFDSKLTWKTHINSVLSKCKT